jgi:transposase InsO family protein
MVATATQRVDSFTRDQAKYKTMQIVVSPTRKLKKSNKNYRELPPKKNPELIPWHTLCVDLVGPYPFSKIDKKKNINTYTELWCITMIDPATGWFEIAEIPTKPADFIANLLEFHWLTRYPWPTKIRMDRGEEFKAEVQAALKDEYGITVKRITTRNPQSNSIIERILV